VQLRGVAQQNQLVFALTQDASTQQEEEETDEVWQREGSAVESETSLRNELKAFFQENEVTTMKHCHQYFKEQFAHRDNIKIMSYSTFIAFMNGSRSKPLKKDLKKLQMLLATHAGTQLASL
jgi:hypothetical protein